MQFKIILFLSLCFVYMLYGQNSNLRKGVFLAHSTGTNIWGPNGSNTSAPQEIIKYNNSHNFSGDKEFNIIKEDWPTNPWTNEWVRWHQIFDGVDSTADIQPYLNNYGIIIIKSCFPSSGIGSWGSPLDTLEPDRKTIFNYKWHWRNFIKKMESHREVFFIVWTNAPLVAKSTDDNEAFFSDQFCRWAKDTLATGLDSKYGDFPSNVYVFDFFHKLAGPDGKLPVMYALDSTDSHPNAAATELVAPQFVKEILDAVLNYENITPVELIKFSSTIINNQVQLNWETATEINNYGFEVERKEWFDNENNIGWVSIGFIPGSGNSNAVKKYSYVDKFPREGI
ncbi:MAG: hypothetical protein M1480_12680, partial [Bacteroidetes bacterium]|nr:hypothetical protein [Bacteroidota bacterium]